MSVTVLRFRRQGRRFSTVNVNVLKTVGHQSNFSQTSLHAHVLKHLRCLESGKKGVFR